MSTDTQGTKPALRHTPGPWRVRTTGNIGNCVEGQSGKKSYDGDDGYRTVALFQDACASGNYLEQEANRASNGRLIAAAPELADSGQEMLDNLDQIQPAMLKKLGLDVATEKLRAALAKAGVP